MAENEMRASPATLPACPDLAADILRGADEIAAVLFGSAGERRKVYHLVSRGGLPVFRLGAMICARRSKILEWIESQERGGRP